MKKRKKGFPPRVMTRAERFGLMIRERRQARGLKQIPFARTVQIGQGTLSKLERGELGDGRRMGFKMIASICWALDIPMHTASKTLLGAM